MRNLKEIMTRTRASISHISNTMKGKLKTLETNLNDQNQRLADLESKQEPDIHVLEVNELNRKESEALRQNELSDSELRTDLEKEYGNTKWASGVIDRIIKQRTQIPLKETNLARRVYLRFRSFYYQSYNLFLKRIYAITKND